MFIRFSCVLNRVEGFRFCLHLVSEIRFPFQSPCVGDTYPN